MNSVQSGKVYYVSNPDPVNSTIRSSASAPPMQPPIRLLPTINNQPTHIKALPIPGQLSTSAPSVAPKLSPHLPHDSPSSPETSDASSTVSALSRDGTLIMVTKGDSGFFTVDLMQGDDGCLIRERILSVVSWKCDHLLPGPSDWSFPFYSSESLMQIMIMWPSIVQNCVTKDLLEDLSQMKIYWKFAKRKVTPGARFISASNPLVLLWMSLYHLLHHHPTSLCPVLCRLNYWMVMLPMIIAAM